MMIKVTRLISPMFFLFMPYFSVGIPLYSRLSTSMFAGSAESDFLYLRYSPLTLMKNAMHPGGVFAKESFEQHQIICQPRGHLIPIENISHFNIGSILTYRVVNPLYVNGSGQPKEYILVDSTICSRIRFCVPTPTATAGDVGSCGNAVLLPFDASNQLFVCAIKSIPVGAEIVIEVNSFINLNMDTFREECQFDPHGCGILSDGETTTKERGVIPSESLFLFLAPSTIPGAGLGVFSKVDILPYCIITLCVGKVYHVLDHQDADKFDRLTAARLLNGNKVVIQMDNICGYTNDIIHDNFLQNESYVGIDMAARGPIPLLPGLEYNSLQGGELYQVSAIISTQLIPAYTEILQPYGETYWWYRYQDAHGLEHVRVESVV
mmetsp:Transcript_16330/g.30486  ORF Transcript_16330/g.30486 Transcript_16330/m.30486 type:complete len:379 (-) Transcript_16330:67-1203(-)